MKILFLVELVCGLSVCPSDYLKSNKRICMKILPEVCLSGDDPESAPDLTDLLLSEVSLWPLNSGNDPEYDRDPD